MDKEQNYLIELSRAYLNEEKISLKSDIDYRRLYSLAREHNLCGVLYCAVKNAENRDIIEKELFCRLENTFFDLVYASNMQVQTLGELKALLSQAQIRFVLFKGAVLRNLFPVAESRSMGDTDLLIDKENRDKVKELLTANGFACKNSNGPVWDYEKNGVLFEIHTSVINGRAGAGNVSEYFENAVERAVFNGYEGVFPDEYHFEYLIAHIAHHFCFYGAGIKLVLDLAAVLKKCNIDLDRAVSDLSECLLSDFAKAILSVCFKWYGVGRDFGKSTQKTEEFLACHGAFGNSQRSTAAVLERRALEENASSGKIISKIRLLFPSYEKMKEIPYIKFIEGRPYLTPLAWGYRFFYNLKNRKDFMKTAVRELGSEEARAQAADEYDYFKEIGLV